MPILPAITDPVARSLPRLREAAEEAGEGLATDWAAVLDGLEGDLDPEALAPVHLALERLGVRADLTRVVANFIHGCLSLRLYPFERANGTHGEGVVEAYAERVAGINPRTLYIARAAAHKLFDSDVGRFVDYVLEPIREADDPRFARPRPWSHVIQATRSNADPSVLPKHLRAEALAREIERPAEAINEMQRLVDEGELSQEEMDGVIETAGGIIGGTLRDASARLEARRNGGAAAALPDPSGVPDGWTRGYYCAVAVLLRSEGTVTTRVAELFEAGGGAAGCDPDDAALFRRHGLIPG